MKPLVLFVVLLGLCHGLTSQQLNAVNTAVKSYIAQSRPRLWKLIQLSFHDCVSICDGCIDEAHKGNVGLLTVHQDLKSMFSQTQPNATFADFAAAAYTAAVEQALANDGLIVQIPFAEGRTDCATPITNDPLPLGKDIDTVGFLSRTFTLTTEEAVALIGCGHSVGGPRTENSGFHGNWDCTPSRMDHGYFIELLSTGWTTEILPNIKSSQFNRNSACRDGSAAIMMPADFILARMFTQSVDGIINCQIAPCPQRSNAAISSSDSLVSCQQCQDQPIINQIVNGFSSNKASLQRSCQSVFQKMLGHTPEPLRRV